MSLTMVVAVLLIEQADTFGANLAYLKHLLSLCRPEVAEQLERLRLEDPTNMGKQ
jgi:hypothetical protein